MTHKEKNNSPSLTHGGDWAGFAMEYGKEPLDFSMNVNPLGMSMHVRYALSKAGATADRYPDPLCRDLRKSLSTHESVPSDWIFCGNGAADIIFRLAQAIVPKKMLVTAPTFSEYETAFSGCGWEVEHYFLDEGREFRVDDSILDVINENTHVVFLCEPNNPTGVTTGRNLLVKILKHCQKTNTMLIIDECFNGFLPAPKDHSMIDYLGDYENLVILKAFTKLYGMAGVRLGYCLCSNKALVNTLYSAGAPWNVSSLAQAAGVAALEDEHHARVGKTIIEQERPWLRNSLRELGIRKIYGEANYLFFQSVPGLDTNLRERGILIRNCDNYHGLAFDWYRIAIKKHDDNMKLIDAMREVLKNEG